MRKKMKICTNIKNIMSSSAFKVFPATSESKPYSANETTGDSSNNASNAGKLPNKNNYFMETERNILIMVIF